MNLILSLLVVSVFFTTITANSHAVTDEPILVFVVVNRGMTLGSGFISTMGRNVTTEMGGTHKCDGTNEGANPTPGATPTGALADLADLRGFTIDGEWSDEFEEFTITVIDGFTCDWMIFHNDKPVDEGCHVELNQSDKVAWICLH